MTKEEFLDEIKKELGFMPYEEVIKAEKYFESYFNGSEPDEKVIERFGSSKLLQNARSKQQRKH